MEALQSYINRAQVPNVEVELRFYLDARLSFSSPAAGSSMHTPEEMRRLVETLVRQSKMATVSQTINFICGDRIKQLSFKNGERDKSSPDVYMRKTQLQPAAYFASENFIAKLATSVETPIPKFEITDVTMVRIKHRLSLTIAPHEDFRFDVTLMYETTNAPINMLSDLRDKMFKGKVYPSVADTFMNHPAWNFASYVEIEAECLHPDKLTVASFNVIDVIRGITIDIAGGEAPDEYQNVKYRIATLMYPQMAHQFRGIRGYGLKRLGNQVIELTRDVLDKIKGNIRQFYITPKLDGVRTIILIDDGVAWALNDKLKSIPVELDDVKQPVVIDAEEYDGRYYLFDVMVLGSSVMEETYELRLDMLKTLVGLSPLFTLKPTKRIVSPTDFRDFVNGNFGFKTDGVVITPAFGEYASMRVYKYKPPSHLTIDFLIRKCPPSLLGMAPYKIHPGVTTYILFCGITRAKMQQYGLNLIRHYSSIFPGAPRDYFPIQFSPPNAPYAHIYWSAEDLDGRVGEFARRDGAWVLTKIRVDRDLELQSNRYFGNFYDHAVSIWNSIGNPLLPDNIVAVLKAAQTVAPSDNPDDIFDVVVPPNTTSTTGAAYFEIHDSQQHRISRDFNNSVKFKIYEVFANASTVLDLACGKGQDLFKFKKFGVRRLICLDESQEALDILQERRKQIHHMQINTLRVDLSQPAALVIAAIDTAFTLQKVPRINCSLAMHYFMSTEASCGEFAKLVSHYLEHDGLFLATFFDGSAVFDLLSTHGGAWRVDRDGAQLYGITAKYRAGKLAKFGQKIDVFLPFSHEPMEEPLVNIRAVTTVFKKHDLILESYKSYSTYINMLSRLANADDRMYVGLYHFALFRKKATVAREPAKPNVVVQEDESLALQ